MSVSYVDVLSSKRSEVLTSIETLRKQISELTALVNAKEGQLRNIDDLLAIENATGSMANDSEAPTPPQRGLRFLDRAFEILNSHGEPLHYRTLAQKLADAGIYVPGQDPAANLLSQMTRDPRFGRATGRGIYGLVDWPSMQARRTHKRQAPSRRKVAAGTKRG